MKTSIQHQLRQMYDGESQKMVIYLKIVRSDIADGGRYWSNQFPRAVELRTYALRRYGSQAGEVVKRARAYCTRKGGKLPSPKAKTDWMTGIAFSPYDNNLYVCNYKVSIPLQAPHTRKFDQHLSHMANTGWQTVCV